MFTVISISYISINIPLTLLHSKKLHDENLHILHSLPNMVLED